MNLSEDSVGVSLGIFIYGVANGVEALDEYSEGGYHPIHLGDCLGTDGQYRVIHKLGFGSFSTIWLCRDTEKDKYVSLKITTADAPSDDRLCIFIPESEYTAPPMDSFTINGPNGLH